MYTIQYWNKMEMYFKSVFFSYIYSNRATKFQTGLYFNSNFPLIFTVTEPPKFQPGETEAKISVPTEAANSVIGFQDSLAAIDEG